MDPYFDSPTPLVIFEEFLVAHELAALLDSTLSRTADFTSTGVLDQVGNPSIDTQYRRSRVIFDLNGYESIFINRIFRFLPQILARLGIEPFPVSNLEIQLTATNNGEYFKMHSDNHSDAVRSRALTFVYYFFREPKAFEGGELRVFDNRIENGHVSAAPQYRLVMPEQNQIVFFSSDRFHEILPVHCSGDFADSRFTVNGWLHR